MTVEVTYPLQGTYTTAMFTCLRGACAVFLTDPLTDITLGFLFLCDTCKYKKNMNNLSNL